MKISRALGTSAAAAVVILAPQAAFAADDYGDTGNGDVSSGDARSVSNGSVSNGSARRGSTLPSTGSTALDGVIGGAGLLLLIGGGATLVAARRKEGQLA